jgi:hypothetical protein
VCTQEVGFTQEGKNSKEGFGGADFILKKLESVGQGVADGPTESAKAKAVKKSFGLVSDAGSTVLEVAVVEA